ncbi:MAG: TIGR04283 family arsenosugar biosynthesis glycosyltransferase [Pseudomonas sp.]|uniref:TIGR04283 family arsenosugar biosynthesis glycosyltransferase n=1 Tax=Pseudomonas sp. TaxID=306 RepID=UPI003397CBBB
MSVPTLSIIIPVLNEVEQLPGVIEQLAPLRARGAQLILVDGGSTDGTAALPRVGLEWVESAPGRARQMNAGAALARGEVLLFLHADTCLPADADDQVARALVDDRCLWGRFDVRIAGRPWMLPVVAFLMNQRSRLSAIATGDQAIFVRRATFETLGGFAELPLMEDIELSTRLRRLSAPACPRGPAITSGRRWERRGVWRTIWLMWRLRWAYWRGVPASRIAEAYR